MGHFSDPSDEDLERLLSGMAPAGNNLHDLAALVRDVHSAYCVVPDKVTEDRHVLPIVAAAQLLADKGNPVVRPASKAHGSAKQTSGLPTWRRKTVLSSLFASLSAKIAGVAMAATAATGGLAATGTLPAPAQTAVANIVENVGITIPNPGKPSADHRQDADHRKDEGKRQDADHRKDEGKRQDDGKGQAGETDEQAKRGNASGDHRQDTDHRQDAGKGPGSGTDAQRNGGDKSVSDDVKEAVQGDYESGRDKGAAVSDAADQNRQDGEHAQDKPTPVPSASPTTPAGNATGVGEDNRPTVNPTGLGGESRPTLKP